MGYDDRKNVEIVPPEAVINTPKMRILMSVHRYQGGAAKVQIDRFIFSKTKEREDQMQAWQWTKLGRLSLEEFNKIAEKVRDFEQRGAFR